MRCSVCKFETNIKTNFRKHLEGAFHETSCQKILACKKCLQTFENSQGYSKHIKSCIVDLCPKKYKSMSNLSRLCSPLLITFNLTTVVSR